VRRHLAPVVLALLLAFAGCGGDDEEPAATTEAPPPTAEPAPTETEAEAETETGETEAEPDPEPEPEPEPEEPAGPPASPEDQPGGAGDEEPAQSLALLTGENGRITPRRVRVPAFISIRVELRSKDEEYGLRFRGATLRVSDGLGSASTTIDGLRPGEAVVGIPTGPGNRVRIEATAEPGP
jgi:hypothetical protein